MKTLKRILSVTLAFLMIFSSVSILSSAVVGDGNENSFTLTTKFYREDPDTGDWIETTKAAKGEDILARVFLETDYYASDHTLFWLYPTDFMTFKTSNYKKTSGLYYTRTGSRYTPFENYDDDDSMSNLYYWEVSAVHATEPGGFADGDFADLLVDNGYVSAEEFENKGWLALQMYLLDMDIGAVKISDDYYLYQIMFTVNDDATGVGTLKTPEGSILTPDRPNATLNIKKYPDPTDITYGYTMRQFQADWTLDQDAYVTTQSAFTFDVDGDVTTKSADIGTVYSDNLEADGVTNYTVTDPAIGKVFLGWDDASTAEEEKYTSAEVAAMEVGYDDMTFNAVFEAAEASYFVKVVEQNEDGTWPTDEEIAAIEAVEKETAFDNTTSAKLGDVINAKDYAPVPDGFTVYNTTDTVTVTDDDTDVLVVKLARDEVTVTFDGGSSVTGLYGSTQTAPVKTTDAGYSNEGWYTTDANGALVDKVAADGGEFKMPAAATNYTSNIVADAQDLTVNVTYYDTIANKLQTVPVTLEGVTATGNQVEIVEALPENPVDGTDYVLISDITKEAELEHYAFDATSASNNLSGTASATGLTLTVGYAAKSYAVTFDTAVDDVADVTETVTYGGTVAASKLPTEAEMEAANPGYSFEGWYNGDVQFVPGETIVTGEATYTAKFTANKVKITYSYAGDDIPAGDEYALPADREDAVINETFTLPAITAPEGYTLKWTVEGATKVDETTYKVGTTDVTVTGTWTLNTYTIYYYYWEEMTDADLITSKEVQYKGAIPADVTADMPGYLFTDWAYYTDNDPSTADEVAPLTMPAHDLYAVATLQQVGYLVQFMKYDNIVGGETEDEKAAAIFDTSDEAVWNDFVYATTKSTVEEGYNFTGWVDAEGNAVSFPMYVDESWGGELSGFKSVVKVYASYQPKTINVEFDPAGGYFDNDPDSTASKIVPTVFGKEIVKDADDWNIARDHYTFSEWMDWYDGATVEAEDVYYEAMWLPNIEYAFAGTIPAGVKVPATVEGAEYGTVIDVPALAAAGYSYTVSYSDDAMPEDDGTYTVADTPVTVTYNWTADGDVAYTVETYLENLNVTDVDDVNNYTLKDTLTRTGTTGGDINFQEDLYEGFTYYKQVEADATIGGDGNTVVKVYYTRDKVKVTITDENGDPIVDENGNAIVDGEYDYGDSITEPTVDQQPETSEPGMEFDQWTYEDGTPVEWPLIVDSEDPIVIVPTYKNTLYSITYKSAGVAAPTGFELPSAEYANVVESAIYGDDVPVPAWDNDTVPGYNVTITVENALDEGNGAYTVEESDVTVTATWSYDIFTVTYVTVGTAPDGYAIPNAEFANNSNATIGTKVAVPDWTAPAGYAFELKVEGAERQNDGTYEVYNDNVTVTATWTALESTYVIHTFVMDLEGNYDEANPAVSSGTGTTGLEATYTAPAKEGFTPDKESYTVVVTNDDTDIIKVYYSRNKKDLKYSVNGTVVNTVPTYYGAAIDLEYQPADETIPAGKDFLGWSLTEGATTPDDSATMGDAETTLYAVLKDTDYSITYATVGTAPAGYELPNADYANTEVAHYGETVKVPNWNNDTVAGYNVTITVTGAVEADGAYKVGEDNVTVTATWTYDEYALTYSYDASAPAGADVPAAEELYVGKVVTLATPAAVAGYTFAGWVIDGKTYDAGASYTAGAADAEAVGSWTANEGVTYFIRRHFEVLGQDGLYGAEEKLITKTGKAGDAISYSEKVTGFDFYKQEPADATIGGDGQTVVDVYYNRKTVTVTVYNEDGTVNDDLSGEYEYGSSIAEPNKPESSDEGKSFNEWQYEDGTSVTWPIKIESEDPIVIKPDFYNNTYTVRFLINADKVYTEDTEAEYSTTIAKPADPDPAKVGMTGYTFIEWRRGSVDGAAWTAADTVPVNGVDYYAYFTPNSDITYKINKYFQNVELTDWDYSLTKVETVTDATAGEEVTLDLKALAVEGFTIDEANSVIKQVINGNGKTEFVVYYLRNKTTVNVDGVEEEVIFGDTITEEEAEQIMKDNGTYDEGYEYTGWTDEKNQPVTFPYTIPASGGKLTPVYTLKSFTLTFVDEKGNEVQSGEVVYKSALADVTPAYPTKEGYTPTGWYDVTDGTAMPATMPAKDVTYKVAYTNATNTAYKITIYVMDLEGNYSIVTTSTSYGTTGDTARIEPTEYIGLYEDTTHPDRNLSAVIAADGSTELKIFYARQKYTVTYDGTPVEAFYGSAIPAPAADPVAPAKGKEFAGWFDAEGNEPSDYASMPADDLEFTSSWTDAEYTVTFVVNGTVTTKNYNYGEAIETPETPNVPGMNFTGWVCDGVAGIPATMPDYDIVVVAQFGTAFYTVTFLDDVNGAEFEKITVMYGAAITLPAETPTKEYHTFVKWSNVPETMPAENIVIVPEFERVPVKLVPKNDEATTVIDYDEKIIYGLKTNLSDTVLREQFLAVAGDGYMVINTYNGQYGFYGTGATVDLYDNVTGELLETYTIVVFGDINGDSRINSTDSSMVTNEVNRTDINSLWSYEALATYNKYKTMAADINMDGKVNATDKGTITNATLGSVRIDQVTREVIRAEA